MTPVAICYFIIGCMAIVWPLILLHFKRSVLGAQWLMVASVAMFGLSIILYSLQFNSFLQGEYLMVLFFMMFALTTPLLVNTAMAAMLRPQGVSHMARALFFPSVAVLILLALSVAVGGVDMYRLWLQRGTDGYAGVFYPNSWRYNTIVAVHYYLFWTALIVEMLYVIIGSIKKLHNFRALMKEYYTPGQFRNRSAKLILYCMMGLVLTVTVSFMLFPFNTPRPLWVAILTAAVQSLLLLISGYNIYRLDYGAENLLDQRVSGTVSGRKTGRQILQYIEQQKAYLNPDMTVFSLSKELHVSQDDIIDAIHQIHGSRFGDYVDGLRIEYAMQWMMENRSFDVDKRQELNTLAHRCGYFDAEALTNAFQQVVQQPIEQWFNRQ